MPTFDSAAVLAHVRRLCATAPRLAAILGEILDRRERSGALPGRITVVAGPAEADALAALLSPRAVRQRSAGKVALDIAGADSVCREQHGLGLDDLFYAALDRRPRDPAADADALRAALERGLADVRRSCRADAGKSLVDAEIAAVANATGETHALATGRGVQDAVAEVERVVRCVEAAIANEAPIRMANFATTVLGDSKALAVGSDRLRRVANALLDHHQPTLEAVHIGRGDITGRQARRLALEVRGVHRDESTLTAYCFGPLVYEKRGQHFDHVAAHAALGDVAPLSLAQLKGARIFDLPVRRALVIENQTPFLDYVEAHGARADEVIVCSRGQASWAVVQLLRMIRRAGVPIAHSGDLDRSGVLILRSLETRALGPIEPVAMDVATFDAHRSRGRPLTDRERTRLADRIARDDPGARCGDLLTRILDAGVWIEQEAFFAEAVIGGT